MGILYAEGSRRYLEALSTYTRRRISQSKQSDVKEIRHIPIRNCFATAPKRTIGAVDCWVDEQNLNV